MNRRGKALAPVVSREMSGHILDGGRVDEIGVRTGVICDANPKSVKGMGYSIVDPPVYSVKGNGNEKEQERKSLKFEADRIDADRGKVGLKAAFLSIIFPN
jgi:hypothetical protein